MSSAADLPPGPYEVWDAESGNRLFVSADLHEALVWVLDYRREGDTAAFSVGDEQNRWVVKGDELDRLVRRAAADEITRMTEGWDD